MATSYTHGICIPPPYPKFLQALLSIDPRLAVPFTATVMMIYVYRIASMSLRVINTDL